MLIEYLNALSDQVISDLSPELMLLGVCIANSPDGSMRAEVVVLDGFTEQVITLSEPAPDRLRDYRLQGIHTGLRLVARMEEYLREGVEVKKEIRRCKHCDTPVAEGTFICMRCHEEA